MTKRTKVLLILAAFVVAASVAMAGYEKAKQDKARPKDNIFSQVELFADAVSILRSDYVDEIDSRKLIYGALKGMASALDEFSQFMEPDEYNEIKVETRGEFGGIGIEISMRDGILTVIAPIADTPAEAAGVRPGDKIVKINGQITKKMTINEAVKSMRGRPGAMITLTIWRESDKKILEIPIRRALVKIQSIKKAELIVGKTGYIKLVEFQEKTPTDLEEALRRLEAAGMDSLILDLRNNPGGLLDIAVKVSEKFLPKDKMIVSTKARNPAQNAVFKSSGRFPHLDHPLVVMVNEGSASASEIFAGAIRDNKRGLILGTKTFGKASIQTVIPLKDGSALRFTTASYLTPNGTLIKNEGIVPDIVVERQEYAKKKDEAEDIFERLDEKGFDISKKEEAPKKDKLEKDNQLESAVNLIKAMKIYRKETR